ncbi:hypothetical protein EZV62_004030 [Acer yangbiense]|uniref:RNase H type-1 domain-containing protein n=1 Tax=Acer yangbiense TaxID=1000413 RepID=A0A5C7IJ34_9ROSI|nr:hypothetical protein EZV62_004030 [Acer yangbiense]
MIHISDIKLIRTDTTLDLSQKAEKGISKFSHFCLAPGLLWGRQLLEFGSRWGVGNGTCIGIYSDHWLPCPHTFMVFSSPVLGELVTVDILKTVTGQLNRKLWVGRRCFYKISVLLTLALRLLVWVPKCFVGSFVHKINVDASIAATVGLVGVGVVIRDNMGCVMAARLKWYSDSFSIEITESLAVLKGLELASDHSNLVVEKT